MPSKRTLKKANKILINRIVALGKTIESHKGAIDVYHTTLEASIQNSNMLHKLMDTNNSAKEGATKWSHES